MVDSRTQTYWQLIEMLLNNQAQKDEVLNLNQELIDKGLVDEMREVAGYLAAQGDERSCEFFRDLADELATKYGTVTFTCCIDFLLEVLSLTERSNGNQEEVYSFLKGKEDKLNIDFLYTLKLWATEYLKSEDLEKNQGLAKIIFTFSRLIQEFPRGDKAINQEIALTGNKIALTVYTLEIFPKDWANTLVNLAVVYINRISGETAKNIEMAIQSLKDALIVRTRKEYPERWADIQTNLGCAYY